MRFRHPLVARWTVAVLALLAAVGPCAADQYRNLESGHVNPLALNADGSRLYAVNTPDAVLEILAVDAEGRLSREAAVPVGLEPVSVRVAPDGLAWVVNQLSDTVSLVDPALGLVVQTLPVGDEPTDVAFAGGRAFVSSAGRDRLEVFDAPWGDTPPSFVELATRKPRALAVTSVGGREVVLAVGLHSGNRTTIVNANVIERNGVQLDPARLADLGLADLACDGAPTPRPPRPAGVAREPGLPVPAGGGEPQVGLIVRWDEAAGAWLDDAGQDWSHCARVRLGDHDLFAVDAQTLSVQSVQGLGTTLFDVSVQPGSQRVWVPNTEARNHVRFEHALGLKGHVVDNRLSVVDLGAAPEPTLTIVDLNAHVDRASEPPFNFPERLASISQPGRLVWTADGTRGYLTGLGSAKVFEVDGGCLDGSCIFGPDRLAPRAAPVLRGPSGLALDETRDRLFVMSRFDNAITIIEASTLSPLENLALHDPSTADQRDGRPLMYDAIQSSAHGDAACSSCHVFGDRDDLAWDLGDPGGEFVAYTEPNDNVRFMELTLFGPQTCDPADCASQTGFDPEKGPMTTQTLRGMLEPLHWRGDRPTFASFNGAFVSLLGAEDVSMGGPAAGLPDDAMALFRRFALDLTFPPNPNRTPEDELPDAEIEVPGSGFTGNPATGLQLFDTFFSDDGQAPCQACHAHPFGAAGGVLGGVTPLAVTAEDAAALFNGDDDLSFHSDLKVPHLRNMYEKKGPIQAAPGEEPVESVGGFGFAHDGSLPDLRTFLSVDVFTIDASQVEDIASYLLHFPTGTRPMVGHHVTLPPGAGPTGPPEAEARLARIESLGDAADPAHHCEGVAHVPMDGELRRVRLEGGVWLPDRADGMPLTTAELRAAAEAPISFLCAFDCDGHRLGGDRDSDGVLDGDDCAPDDGGAVAAPEPLGPLLVSEDGGARLSWADQSAATGPSLRHDVVGGTMAALWSEGLASAECVALEVQGGEHLDSRDPAGDGFWYLVRARNACGAAAGDWGRPELAGLDCGR